MWPRINPSSFSLIMTACVALLAVCPTAFAQTNATVHLKSGPVLSGEVKTIGPTSLSIALAGATSALSQNYADISRIEWPEPELWLEAMAAFDRGETKEAFELFSKLSTAPAEISFNPAPGNFAERARRMLLLCHRRLRNGAAIAKLVRQIDWAKLPEEERAVSPLLKVWSLVGAADWKAARTAADEAARNMDGTDPDQLELSFLQARIAGKLGLTDEAISAYAACYTLPSSDAGLAADALRESVALFLALPDRTDELRALVHLYATTIGRGKLWKDAPAEATKLLAEAISAPAPPPTAKSDMSAPVTGKESAPASGDWVTVTKFRFEPPPAGTPPPAPDPNAKPLKFVATGGTFKSTEAPADWKSAETRVAQFTTAKAQGTLLRQLKDDTPVKLAKGKTLRMTIELRLGKLDTKVSKSVERVSFLRFGLLDANKAGYGIHLPLLANAKGIPIMGDTGGDDDLLAGPGVLKIPAEGLADKGIQGGKPLPCEITLQLQEDGKLLITARVDGAAGSATVDSAAGQPIVTDFTGGFIVIRVGKPKTSVLFDNLVIEMSP